MSTESMFRRTPPPSLHDFDALAQYNAERSRGIMHRPEWVARMAQIQECFNDAMSRRLEAEVAERESKPPRWWRRAGRPTRDLGFF